MGRIKRWHNQPGHVCVELEGGETAPEKLVCWLHQQGFESGELVIHFRSSGYYDPGVLSGPIDRSYPPEREEERLLTFAEFDGVTLPKAVAEEVFDYYYNEVEEAELDNDWA